MRRGFLSVLVLLLAACASSDQGGLPEAGGLVVRGEEALRAGRLDEARALFAEAAFTPQHAYLAWIGLARTAIARGDAVELERSVTEALRADPGTPATRALTGRTLLLAARAKSPPDARLASVALGCFRRAASEEPDLPGLAYHTGLAARMIGDVASAASAWEAALETDPAAREPLRGLLDLYREAGDRAGVARTLRRAAELRGAPLGPEFDPDRDFATGK